MGGEGVPCGSPAPTLTANRRQGEAILLDGEIRALSSDKHEIRLGIEPRRHAPR